MTKNVSKQIEHARKLITKSGGRRDMTIGDFKTLCKDIENMTISVYKSVLDAYALGFEQGYRQRAGE